ncbi:hypothetical protein SAMN05421820_105304 [Pedobacter steynii]|uniref:Uncharacterized protein n=1 Tax=Pedobacter steynii TaxID=430522 RepID=A0A1G9WWM6_9SPHI|nr:hypothetical protein SAMN05421820_105304 [Pedobacter steynii]
MTKNTIVPFQNNPKLRFERVKELKKAPDLLIHMITLITMTMVSL